MQNRFDYFLVLAEMRTGSNFLEENLNQYPGLRGHGELFNPHFLGGPEKTEKFGISMQERTDNPSRLIAKIKSFPDGLHGFRYFHDHDPRVFDECLNDRGCAKIILTRNPVESYVSREIARQTQQWRLRDMKNVKSARIKFDADEFTAHLDRHQGFQRKILKSLQISGQTGFYLAYEDISDVAILNGLARFLGVSEAKKKSASSTKKQNPQPLQDKVTNFAEMQAALASVDYFALNAVPNFEPRRGAALSRYVAAPRTPLIFAPIAAGPTGDIRRWLADLDGAPEQALITGFNQKSLRHWKRKTGKHRTFTVLRHPVHRLHHAFIRHILIPGEQNFATIRQSLIENYALVIPTGAPDADYDARAHRAAFISFANFVRGNLNGQTSIRVDQVWATQSGILRGFGQFVLPDYIFREQDLAADLENLAAMFAMKSPDLSPELCTSPISLQKIYNSDVEAAVRAAYQRDYMMFGFGPWRSS